MIPDGREVFLYLVDELMRRFQGKHVALRIDPVAVVDGLKEKVFLIHLAEKFPSDFVSQTIFAAVFIPEGPLEADVFVGTLAEKAELEELLMGAVITQEVHKHFKINFRDEETGEFFFKRPECLWLNCGIFVGGVDVP